MQPVRRIVVIDNRNGIGLVFISNLLLVGHRFELEFRW
jgi:hypothetical protein